MKKIKYVLLFIIFIFISFQIWQLFQFRVCMCTIGKLENLYIREYISHYKSYSVDKIFIYDNNDINGEYFENVISDYITNGFAEIINYRGKTKHQLKAYQECLLKNYKKYKWLIFFDLDEFIYLKNFHNIKDYLKQKNFYKCQAIQLNLFFHNDNNLLFYDNRSLSERFREKTKTERGALKTILKGNIKIMINSTHNLNTNLISCNGFGKFNKEEKNSIFTNIPDYKYFYIDHFAFKSTEEFINKLNKGDVLYENTDKIKLLKIDLYFLINNITKRKIYLLENHTKLNLSKYLNKISNNLIK